MIETQGNAMFSPLRKLPLTSILLTLAMNAVPSTINAEQTATIALTDETGAAGRVQAPVSVEVSLPQELYKAMQESPFQMAPLDAKGPLKEAIPVQLEPLAPDSARGLLWWIMPAGFTGAQKFRLEKAPAADAGVTMKLDEENGQFDFAEQGKPVLRFNHGMTKAPEGMDPALRRGDYISALYGPNGELMTEDYPKDHPHHRAINWSWATIRWNGETRDQFAVKGVWAIPSNLGVNGGGPVLGYVHAESVWLWTNAPPTLMAVQLGQPGISIADEKAVIRVFRSSGAGRFVDIEITLTARVEGLEFCGRLDAGYSGFNLRMAPGEGQQIVLFNDSPDVTKRRSWGDYSAVFKGGQGRSGVAVLQNASNPLYPSDWLQYPALNFFQPAFPGGKLIPMPKDQPIVLRYRLWVHGEAPDATCLSDLWTAYNLPPNAQLLTD